MADSNDVICPFCGERGFDLIGLKGHLEMYCEVFENLDNPLMDLMRRRSERESKLDPKP